MRFRVLLVAPLVWAGVLGLGHLLLHGGSAYDAFLRTEIEMAKAMTLLGSWAAALAFERGAYLRRAWFFIGLCMALLLLRDLTLAPIGIEQVGVDIALLRGVLVVLANISQILGTWMLARAWRVADLALPGPRWGQLGMLVASVVMAGVLAGPGVVANGGRLVEGDLTVIPSAASALGDAISLVLIAPLLLTALALRGGLLAWPWALLTTSYLAWLLYDAALVFGPTLGLDNPSVRILSELFRALGCLYGFSGGMAQRLVGAKLRSVRPGAAG